MDEPVQVVDTLPGYNYLPLVEQPSGLRGNSDAASPLSSPWFSLVVRPSAPRSKTLAAKTLSGICSEEILQKSPIGRAMSDDADSSGRASAAVRKFPTLIIALALCLVIGTVIVTLDSLLFSNRLDSFKNVSTQHKAHAKELAANGFWVSCAMTNCCAASSGGVHSAACIKCIACYRSPDRGHAEDCLYLQLLQALNSTTPLVPDRAVNEPRIADWRRLWQWLGENPGSFLAESMGYPRSAVVLAACRLFCRGGQAPVLDSLKAGDILKEIHDSGLDSMKPGMVDQLDLEPMLSIIAEK